MNEINYEHEVKELLDALEEMYRDITGERLRWT